MIPQPTLSSAAVTEVRLHRGRELIDRLPQLEAFARRGRHLPLGRHPVWLRVLEEGLGQTAHCLEAMTGEQTAGFLPLMHVRSLLFGGFLVSLPYLNSAGVMADRADVRHLLIDHALPLADALRVRYLELRHEEPVAHPALNGRMEAKVHMRLPLPATAGRLWDGLSAKVRNQVRKGQKSALLAVWGGLELLPAFYAVFSHNMRDLGTPVYGRRLFESILRHFPDRAELCVVRAGTSPAAAALLLHGWGVSEVPSASSLRRYNPSCANMLLYWHLLERAVQRGQELFDFGRSTRDGNTYRFKKQWGATPTPTAWQFYLRSGGTADMRPENPRYQRFVRLWQRLPVCLTRLIGPAIVRGIP
jgi:FemAB-related protein (PEP-CTERM system-associated)